MIITSSRSDRLILDRRLFEVLYELSCALKHHHNHCFEYVQSKMNKHKSFTLLESKYEELGSNQTLLQVTTVKN